MVFVYHVKFKLFNVKFKLLNKIFLFTKQFTTLNLESKSFAEWFFV